MENDVFKFRNTEIHQDKKESFRRQIGNIDFYFSTPDSVNQDLSVKINRIRNNGIYLDYKKSGEKKEFLMNGILSGGKNSYVISRIDNKDKWSDDYLDCTGVLFSGVKKDTKEKISFITHQDPSFFIGEIKNKIKFKQDLEIRIDAFIRMCEFNSIKALIFGGNDLNNNKDEIGDDFVKGKGDSGMDIKDFFSNDKFDVYIDSINFLNKIILEKLKNSPIVVLGPNDNWKFQENKQTNNKFSLSVYFDNNNCQLYIIGPSRTYSESFSADMVFEVKNFKKDEK